MAETIQEDDFEEDDGDVYHPSYSETPKNDPVEERQFLDHDTQDLASWKLEVERVTPALKIQLLYDHNWRIHLDQILKHQQVILAFYEIHFEKRKFPILLWKLKE